MEEIQTCGHISWGVLNESVYRWGPFNCHHRYGTLHTDHILLLLIIHLVMCDSLQPHELQYTRLPCPSPPPWVCSDSCLLSQWCHPTISPLVTHFYSCPQSFPESGSFPMSWLFTSGGQSFRASASATSPSNEYLGLISFSIDLFDFLAVQGTPKSFLQHHSSKTSILWHSALFMVHISHSYITTGKTTYWGK